MVFWRFHFSSRPGLEAPFHIRPRLSLSTLSRLRRVLGLQPTPWFLAAIQAGRRMNRCARGSAVRCIAFQWSAVSLVALPSLMSDTQRLNLGIYELVGLGVEAVSVFSLSLKSILLTRRGNGCRIARSNKHECPPSTWKNCLLYRTWSDTDVALRWV